MSADSPNPEEIEVTEAMIEAARPLLWGTDEVVHDVDETAVGIYRAMESERRCPGSGRPIALRVLHSL
jgi:hypothetical protein